MNKKISLILISLILLAGFMQAQDISDEKICGVYFTYLHCGNCAYTDPLILQDWLNRLSHPEPP